MFLNGAFQRCYFINDFAIETPQLQNFIITTPYLLHHLVSFLHHFRFIYIKRFLNLLHFIICHVSSIYQIVLLLFHNAWQIICYCYFEVDCFFEVVYLPLFVGYYFILLNEFWLEFVFVLFCFLRSFLQIKFKLWYFKLLGSDLLHNFFILLFDFICILKSSCIFGVGHRYIFKHIIYLILL